MTLRLRQIPHHTYAKVLCIKDLTTSSVPRLRRSLSGLYPYWLPTTSLTGWIRYPSRSMDPSHEGKSQRGCYRLAQFDIGM